LPSSLLGYPDYGAMVVIKGDHFLFDLVFIKKNNQTKFFFKKTETDRIQFKPTGFGSVFRTKTGSTGLVRFFQVFLVRVRFGFRLIKSKPNRSVFSKF
jgi:hypothetical protein